PVLGTYRNPSSSVVLPRRVVTFTPAGPGASPGGVTQRSVVLSMTVTPLAARAPKRTIGTEPGTAKPLPVIRTSVPPSTGPKPGATASTAGGSAQSPKPGSAGGSTGGSGTTGGGV